jgi:transcriptional regulatory protein LevR
MPESKSRKRKSPSGSLRSLTSNTRAAVLNGLTSISGQRTYEHAIREFVSWYCSEPRLTFNRTVVLRCRIHLANTHRRRSSRDSRSSAGSRMRPPTPALLSPELAAGSVA